MQGHRGRITRKELKEDEFVTRAVQVSEYIQQNYPKVLAAVGAVVIAILIGVFVRDQINQRAVDAVAALGSARVALASGNMEDALRKAEQVVSDYSGKPVAAQAALLLADIHFSRQEWVQARGYFEKYLDEYGSDGPAGYGAWSGVAACMEEQGNAAEAANEYMAYADRHPNSAFAPMALREAARCFESAGDRTQAEAALRRILKDFADTPAARNAKSELALMGIQA